MTLLKLSSILLLAALSALPASALTLGELEKSYDDKQSEIRLEKDKSVDGLKQSYLGALARIMTKYQRAGRLDEVLLVKDEMKDISNEKWPLLALPKKISLEVAAPRKIYLKKYIEIGQNAARQTAETADKMLALLEKQAVNLTKKDDLQQALLARQIKADIESDTKLTDARKLLANVMTDGRSKPALRIRRYGDNIEVLVRYDARGKVSPDSPISNVKEKDKAIGDTTATVLGEFIGTEGYDIEPLTVFEQSFGQKDLGPLLMRGIVPTFKKDEAGEIGVGLSIDPLEKNWRFGINDVAPPSSAPGTVRVSCRYFIPRKNKEILGFKFTGGVDGIKLDKLFEKRGKWITESVEGTSAGKFGTILCYPLLNKTGGKANIAKASTEYLVLASLKVEQIKFSAFIVQRLGANGVITETFEDPTKQPKFATNGKLLTQ